MESRRDFLKKATMLSANAFLISVFPPVIQKALAINPEPGSTFYNAEHIVFLMQENRSFDHQLGTLRGVRGFNDPRAIQLPDKNKVWLQTNAAGDTYCPFRLDVKGTKVAWMGSLPHTWTDQTDAMNNGKHNKWLDVKKTRNKDYSEVPLTMGYCERSDLPFYYALADAFTVCDQNFCSSITGTHPNRHYWMSGNIREGGNPDAKAHVWNVSNDNYPELDWQTYPERLESNGVSWKVYQNDLTMGNVLKGEEDAWLGNFGTNVLEYFKQYNVRLHKGGINGLQIKKANTLKQIETLEKQAGDEKAALKLAAAKKLLINIEKAIGTYTEESFNALSDYEKALNNKAFVTNINDPEYHTLAPLKYDDAGTERVINAPKGDVFHQFRADVKSGQLPTVSWLIPPGYFSDHPGEPWFGPWYVSEAMEILLQNPEVWKKTIFIITYDENDGYFDHVPPYVVPDPYKENTGKVSAGIDPKLDFANRDQQMNPSATERNIRESSIGLGYRVPMFIVSPWTRGGFVCSELFDHTSSLQFLENFLEKKLNKKIKEENITEWRRTICGDLTSVFRPYNGERIKDFGFLEKTAFLESIHQAKFKQLPANFKKLNAAEIEQINKDHRQSPYFPQQEPGTKPACALPYELYVNPAFDKNKGILEISFQAGNSVFGNRSAGAPFRVYAMKPYKGEPLRAWNYSVTAGDTLRDEWNISDFEDGDSHLRIYGPNGFYREFRGNSAAPMLRVVCDYERSKVSKLPTGNVVVRIINIDKTFHGLRIKDNSYKTGWQNISVPEGGTREVVLNLSKTHGWYDFSVQQQGNSTFEQRFAGHVETGNISGTDPLMGGVFSSES